MSELRYRYELRAGERILATGHLGWERPLEVGDEVTIGTKRGVVDSISPVIGSRENRVVIQMRGDDRTR